MTSISAPRLRLRRCLFVVAGAAVAVLTPRAIASPVLKVTVLSISNPALQAGAGFGESVAGIGDVNGDGVSDLAVGAPGADRAYILSGATRALLRTIVDPNGSGHRFGFAVANAGDVNGDGVDDLAVGAPGLSPSPVPLPCLDPPCPPDPSYGRAFVFSGKTGALLHMFVPADEFTGFGISVASLGDANGDGVPDLAVGMVPFGFASAFGRVYAFSGANSTLLWEVDESGGKQLASFGLRLASISDLNGDGYRDLLVSAPFHEVKPQSGTLVIAGEAYLLSGHNGAVLRTHTNPTPADNDLFGSAMAAVGDQNGDGFEDYVIGEAGEGLVHLVSGKTGASGGTISAPQVADSFGFSLAAVGDQDADGHGDFWIGAPGSGKVYLKNWSGSTLATVVDATPATPPGGFGWSLGATGNLGGDNPGDLIAGKPADSAGSGKAFIVLLAANKPPTAKAGPDQTIECAGLNGTAVVLDGSASTDPDGDALTYEWRDAANVLVGTTAIVNVTVGLGAHTFTLTVSDGFGGVDSDSMTVRVQDTTPPTLSVTLVPTTLWPPNHRLVPIAASWTVSDVCDAAPAVQLISIVSNEPDNGLGDGDTSDDIQGAAIGTADSSFLLRAERSGTRSGRVYTITYRATDASLNATTTSAQIVVPH